MERDHRTSRWFQEQKWHLLTWRNSLNQRLPQRQRQEEEASDKSVHGNEASTQKAQFKLNQPIQQEVWLYSAWMDRWIECCCLFLYEIFIAQLALPTPRQKTDVSALVRQRVGVAVSSTRPDVRQECAHDAVGSMFLPATCYQPQPLLTPLFVSFSTKINSMIHNNVPQAQMYIIKTDATVQRAERYLWTLESSHCVH